MHFMTDSVVNGGDEPGLLRAGRAHMVDGVGVDWAAGTKAVGSVQITAYTGAGLYNMGAGNAARVGVAIFGPGA
jgi:hypothetical protein